MKYHANGWAFPDADEQMMREIGPAGEYQRGQLEAAMTFVTDRSLAIDGGAHVGTWTCVLSQLFEQVIAIEPSPDTFEALAANVERLNCDNVMLRQVALGAEPGTVSIAPLDAKAVALKNTGARFTRVGGPIPCITIDSLDVKTCGFIKLDLEGSEPMAIQGARETLQRCRPILCFENKWLWSRHFGLPKDIVVRELASLRYRLLGQVSHDQFWGPT